MAGVSILGVTTLQSNGTIPAFHHTLCTLAIVCMTIDFKKVGLPNLLNMHFTPPLTNFTPVCFENTKYSHIQCLVNMRAMRRGTSKYDFVFHSIFNHFKHHV